MVNRHGGNGKHLTGIRTWLPPAAEKPGNAVGCRMEAVGLPRLCSSATFPGNAPLMGSHAKGSQADGLGSHAKGSQADGLGSHAKGSRAEGVSC
ncbi:unnamed protein product [Boreogadus saida]